MELISIYEKADDDVRYLWGLNSCEPASGTQTSEVVNKWMWEARVRDEVSPEPSEAVTMRRFECPLMEKLSELEWWERA